MPHFRERHVSEAFRKLCQFSPLVGIFGHRQVGKTTFLEANSKTYRTLDEDSREAIEDPKGFLKRLGGDRSAIDECQLAPPLFAALKVWVQTHKKPGQFLLSGSVRFSSRKAIRESLTGRLATVELFPFVLSELRNDQLPDFLPWALQSAEFSGFSLKCSLPKKEAKLRLKSYQDYLERGGFPGLFHIRETQTRNRIMQDILRTVLDRDLRLVYQSSLPYSDLLGLCRELAKKPLEALEFSQIARAASLSVKTVKHLIDALESIYLVRKVPIEGGGRKGFTLWFEDQFEQNHLAEQGLSMDLKRSGLAYRNARAQFEYRLGSTPTFFCYQTRGGARLPLGLRQGKDVLGILPLESLTHLGRAEKAAIASFLKHYNHSKVLVTVDEEIEPFLEDARTLVLPVTRVY